MSTDYLSQLGVLYHHCPSVSDVDKIASERSYKNRDEITVSPEKMGPVYEEKVHMFFNEHLHEDEEIRYILEGYGYFDVRNGRDEWVRIRLEAEDLIVRPCVHAQASCTGVSRSCKWLFGDCCFLPRPCNLSHRATSTKRESH